ncbi:MAG: acetate/propionate family kinase [Gammaproteobacteria bacterium]|nr:acetate/propionate family kinase [Gammaproteobacteria bacterium]
MADAIAVLNAGSSSVKFALFKCSGTTMERVFRGQKDDVRPDQALDQVMAALHEALAGDRLAGIGHRVVHGGARYLEPVPVDARVLENLAAFVPLAPLHQPHNLTLIRLLLERLPGTPQVACFDTAFHRSNPGIAQRFALPAEFHEQGVRRYGFHGLSYEYLASVLESYDRQAAKGRTIALHLGNGASMCALQGGRSVATTMGFTAVDGLMMGTRSGALDPGVILYLMQQRGMTVTDVEKLIYCESGLLGVSGISGDMRTLLASNGPGAKLAIDLYVYRIRRELGSLAAALGGLDALLFTAGIGEHAAVIRERVCADAAWLGVETDRAANAAGGPRLTTVQSRVQAWVIPTDEERMIARHTHRLLGR